MPVEWTQATFDAMYSIRDRRAGSPTQGQRFGYSREGMILAGDQSNNRLDMFENRWGRLTTLFSIQANDRVLVAGAGFGFLIEVAHDAGYPNVWGVDNSVYIAGNRATEVRSDVLMVEDDIRGGGRVRAALRNLTGDDEFRWIISESVMESYADGTEIDQLLNAAETVLEVGRPASNIVHLVVDSPTLDPPLISRTLEQYNAIRPSHSWVSLQDWQVL